MKKFTYDMTSVTDCAGYTREKKHYSTNDWNNLIDNLNNPIGGNNSQATRAVVNSKKGPIEEARLKRDQKGQKKQAKEEQKPKNLL